MKRRLSATLALLSLLTSLAVVKLWVDSHRHVYVHERESHSGGGRDRVFRQTAVGVQGGVFFWSQDVRVRRLAFWEPPPREPLPPRWNQYVLHPLGMRADHLLPRTTLWNRLGFFKVRFVAAGETSTVWYAPMGSLALVTALPVAAWLAARGRAALRARTRRRRGLCPACGYDLRGLESERCPECGAGEKARIEDGG